MPQHQDPPSGTSPELRPYQQPSVVAYANLIALSGESLGQLFKLTQDRYVIGRAESATVRLCDNGISIRHAELRLENDSVILEVLDRDAETYVNGELVVKRELVNGDRLQLGSIATLKYTTQILSTASPSDDLESE